MRYRAFEGIESNDVFGDSESVHHPDESFVIRMAGLRKLPYRFADRSVAECRRSIIALRIQLLYKRESLRAIAIAGEAEFFGKTGSVAVTVGIFHGPLIAGNVDGQFTTIS